jgi:hypothetical protein
MKAYAIRKRGTNLYLPRAKNGHSYVEPEVNGGALGPRLVVSRRAAVSILSQWLRGHHAPHYETESEGWEHPSYTVCVGTEVEHQPHRKAEEMEIVEFDLVECAL